MALLTPKQAAKELGISESHLQRMAQRGVIAFIDIGIGASVNRRFDPSDIEAFKLSRRTLEARPPPVSAHSSRGPKSASVLPFGTPRKTLDLKRRYPGPPSNLKSRRPGPKKD